MKVLKILGKTFDILTDLFIKGTGIYFIIKGNYLFAAICFGMSSLWQIPILLLKIYKK